MASPHDKTINGWKDNWDKNDIGFHQSQVHKLSEQGLKVVGVDGVKKALQDFYTEHSLEWTEEDAPSMGPDCKVLQDESKKFQLYLGDIFAFDKSVEGQFDCVWDRGSLVALNRSDVERYAAVLKDILRPGGKILVECFEYDKAMFEGLPRPPPPHPVFEDEVRSLYEPECSVEIADRDTRLLKEKDAKLTYYIIVKK